MLGDISKAEHIYIACGYTDMRKSIDGLAAIVQQNFKLDPFSNSLFLFCGRSSTKMKVLYWEGDGFVLLYKRLENGKFVLSNSAESFQLCLNPRLRSKGYRRLNLDKTKYFLLYRTENSTVFVDGIYHQFQDYENKIK